MNKMERVLAAARAFGAEQLGLGDAATLKIVGLPMYYGGGVERWLVRADSAEDLHLVDVEIRATGDVNATTYVF